MNLEKIKVMVNGLKGEGIQCKVNPCANCSKRVVATSVMCTQCGKWVHAKSAKMKRVTTTLAKGFVCEQCANTIKELNKEIYFLTRSSL